MKTEDYLEKQKKMFIRRWYLVQKNQAKNRGETWELDWEPFFELWSKDDRWLNRGRRSDDLCLSRIDMDLGWHPSNVQIITRSQMLKNESIYKKGVDR